MVAVEANPFRLDLLCDLLSHVRCTVGGILEVEQLLREAVEVMDGAGPRHRCHRSGADVPVRRDDEDRARARQALAERAPLLGVAIEFERVHRAAVADEEGGGSAHVFLS